MLRAESEPNPIRSNAHVATKTLVMCGFTKYRMTVILSFISLVVIVHRPPSVSANSDQTRRSRATGVGSTDRPPSLEAGDPDDEPEFVLASACSDYDTSEANDRYYIRELLEDVEGEHVIVSTHYGQLRGVRIKGIPAAGEQKKLLFLLSQICDTHCLLKHEEEEQLSWLLGTPSGPKISVDRFF